MNLCVFFGSDHMLSYFLGGSETQSQAPVPDFCQTDYSNTTESEDPVSSSSDIPMSSGFVVPQLLEAPSDSQAAPREQQNVGLGLTNSDEEDDENVNNADDEPMAPPTPRVPQFSSRSYSTTTTDDRFMANDLSKLSSHHHHLNPLLFGSSSSSHPPHSAIPSSASSSSSSLSTMANTLVSGGPMVLQQMRQQQQQQMFASMMVAAHQSQLQQQQQTRQAGVSPVSPAAMIGTPENLMLPPPSTHGIPSPALLGSSYHPFTNTPTAATLAPSGAIENGMGSTPNSHEQHLAWIRGINAMAKAQGSSSSSTQQPPHQPILPQQPQQQPTASSTTQPSAQEGQQIQQVAQLGLPFTAFPHMAFYGHAAVAAAAALQQGKNPAPEESEEKRAKRLERNRESARISRRRKKERLAAAEARVWRTHQKIAKERQNQIDKLVPGLRRQRSMRISQFLDQETLDAASIMTAVRDTGPSSPIFQAVIEFQFNALQSNLLPRYQKLWLWLTLNEDTYFTAGKEEYNKRDPDKAIVRSSSGKISSKQVGEELMNTADPNHKLAKSDESSAARTCPADDAARMWPLFCHEHKFSVDQEDKFLALHKKLAQTTNAQTSWSKSVAATKAASSLRDAMDFVCRQASHREERTLVGVLRADQISKYRQWIVMNHDRCSRSLQDRQNQQQKASDSESLQDICLRLERVLRLPNTET